MPRPRDTSPLPTPFLVVIDSREQQNYQFQGLVSDARDGRRPLLVCTEVRGLESGDYSIAGYEKWIAIERKSLQDTYSTIGQGRDRFVRELQRLNEMQFAAVVVEASWDDILHRPPSHSQLPPKTVFRSVVAWAQRFPRVSWWMMGSRRLAEVTTFRLLERYWRDHHAQGSEQGQ